MTKALYIHVPFCSNICSYCDFKRIKTNDSVLMKEYVDSIIEQLESKQLNNHLFETIYLGGGTPNYLENNSLEKLLKYLSYFCNDKTEFTIECNPEFINQQQVELFKKYNVNRISLGVQSFNNSILKHMKRSHNKIDVIRAIKLLYDNNINNISCDFIYNYFDMSLNDLNDVFIFIKEYKIKHVSFYSLELKENSLLTKNNYELDTNNEEYQLEYIKKRFKQLGYKRYEVSNWSINKNYESHHNIKYWKMEDWIGLGYGAYGFEDNNYYLWKNHIINPILEENIFTLEEIEKTKLVMGLRLLEGFDLSIKNNRKIFNNYKHLLKNYYIDKNNKLRPDDIDCLNDTISDLFN